jgi:hypothetical protein
MPAADGSPAARLHAGLDRIHALLRQGDLPALPEATAAIEADLADLAAAARSGRGPAPADLAALRRKLDRNALCLQGAARGIRAARRRIAEVRSAATGLAAYDARGGRITGPVTAATVARRL